MLLKSWQTVFCLYAYFPIRYFSFGLLPGFVSLQFSRHSSQTTLLIDKTPLKHPNTWIKPRKDNPEQSQHLNALTVSCCVKKKKKAQINSTGISPHKKNKPFSTLLSVTWAGRRPDLTLTRHQESSSFWLSTVWANPKEAKTNVINTYIKVY